MADRIEAIVPQGSLCDPFGGIGVVGACMKGRGYEVHSGDVMLFAHYFQIARVVRSRLPSFARVRATLDVDTGTQAIPDFLNNCKPVSGWLTRHFSEERSYFTPVNARKADACRLWIRRWADRGLLSASEHAVLLASLIDSLDLVANTAGTYYAHLKSWHRKALRPFCFRLIRPIGGPAGCTSSQCDALDLVSERAFDVLYLDPPYNQRSYAHYYHLPEALAHQRTPRVRGKSGICAGPKVGSAFYNPRTALGALEDILNSARFRLAVIHYSDDGLIPPRALRKLLGRHGKVGARTIQSPGYTSEPQRRQVAHRVYFVDND